MRHLGQALGTCAVWGGSVLLVHVLGTFNLLSSAGAAWIVIGTIITTMVVWNPDILD